MITLHIASGLVHATFTRGDAMDDETPEEEAERRAAFEREGPCDPPIYLPDP